MCIRDRFITICVWAFTEFYLCRKPDDWFTPLEGSQTGGEEIAESAMPSFAAAIIPILLPILLILLASVFGTLLPEGSVALGILDFLGDKNIALAIGIVAGFLCLAGYMPEEERFAPVSYTHLISESILPACPRSLCTIYAWLSCARWATAFTRSII